MNTNDPCEYKEELDKPNSEPVWFTTLSSDAFIDSPESLNLTFGENFDIFDQTSSMVNGESIGLSTSLTEEDYAPSICGQYPETPKLDPGDSDYHVLELGGFTSSTYISGTIVPTETLDFNENSRDDSTIHSPDDFLNVENENNLKTSNGLTDHDYACSSSSPPRVSLIEVNTNRKGAHYQIIKDAVTVVNFNPSLKNRAGTRIPFRSVGTMSATDEIYIFAQYRTDKLNSQSPYRMEDHVASMPNIKMDDSEIRRILEGRGEFPECKCFRSHPTAAFCVTSEKAEVSWRIMSGIPVAKLTVKEESVIDLSIGLWSTKILKEHSLVGKKVFNQIVFHIFDRFNLRNYPKEQSFFYKTCASVTRDISGFYKELEKALPQRPRSDLIPDASVNDSSREGHSCRGRKKLRTLSQMPLKVTINQDCLQEFLNLINSTESGFLKIC